MPRKSSGVAGLPLRSGLDLLDAPQIVRRRILSRPGERRRKILGDENRVENVNSIGDIDVAIVVRVRGITARWNGHVAYEQKAKDVNAVGDVHATVGVGVASDETILKRCRQLG